jgi:hypothetical protein
MKRVVKLTEAQLEMIVKRVISEQSMGVAFVGEENGLKIKKEETKEQQAPSESQGLWKDASGDTYKLPCVNSNDTWGKFVNFAGGSYANATKLLRDFGLNANFQNNPLDVNINWNAITNPKDPRYGTADYVVSAFNDGLEEFAKMNPNPQLIKNLKIKNAKGEDYTQTILRAMPNYFEVLAKVVNRQKKVLGCA